MMKVFIVIVALIALWLLSGINEMLNYIADLLEQIKNKRYGNN